MKLIVFDLDQTIVNMFRFHNKTTEKTFKQVFGVKARMDEVDYVGKTLKKVLIELAVLKGIKKTEREKQIQRTIKKYVKNFVSILPKNMKKYLLPGAYNLIKRLSKNKNNFLIVLTGDAEIIAKTVLRRTGILKNFHFLITGEHAKSRIKLMRIALKKAHKKTKQKRFEKTIVIGDSTHDVEAGKAVGALIITVLTGEDSKSELKKEGADYVFKNFKDKKIVQIIEK